MKKIVPFNNVLTFSTDVCEITSISLEHDLKKEVSSISGIFYITGEYKITDGQLEKEKFNFELPFDIALGSDYNMDTLVVDIDDFRYELLNHNQLKVNIELFIDGEIIPPTPEEDAVSEILPVDIKPIPEENIISSEDREEMPENLIDNISNSDDQKQAETDINVENNNINNIFNSNTFEDQYVTYKVYPVQEGDTIDKIMTKYNVSKEELAQYNNIEEINPGTKLIIPYNDK